MTTDLIEEREDRRAHLRKIADRLSTEAREGRDCHAEYLHIREMSAGNVG